MFSLHELPRPAVDARLAFEHARKHRDKCWATVRKNDAVSEREKDELYQLALDAEVWVAEAEQECKRWNRWLKLLEFSGE